MKTLKDYKQEAREELVKTGLNKYPKCIEFTEKILDRLADEIEKVVVPEALQEEHERHAEDCNGNDHGRNCMAFLDDNAIGHNKCRNLVLEAFTRFKGESV